MKNRNLSYLACACLILSAFLGGLYLGRSIGGTPTYTISTPNITTATRSTSATEGHSDVSSTDTPHSTASTLSADPTDIATTPTQGTTNSSGSININTADLQTLQLLPKIGPKLAQAIIDYREKNGPFHSIGEITNVDGIGAGIFALIKDHITIGG